MLTKAALRRRASLGKKMMSTLPEKHITTRTQCCYAVGCGSYVKIGTSKDVKKRIRQLHLSCPYPVRLLGLCYTRLEREHHESLRQWRHKGEWFKLTDEVRAYLTRNFVRSRRS